MMSISKAFDKILEGSHCWNWAPDWFILIKIYNTFPDSYSVLTPFAFAYLEELIRSKTSDYGMTLVDENGNPKKRKLGKALINLAIEENSGDIKYIKLLKKMEKYFETSKPTDEGDNRHSVVHGFMHSRYWTRESFEMLIHDIALLSDFTGF